MCCRWVSSLCECSVKKVSCINVHNIVCVRSLFSWCVKVNLSKELMCSGFLPGAQCSTQQRCCRPSGLELFLFSANSPPFIDNTYDCDLMNSSNTLHPYPAPRCCSVACGSSADAARQCLCVSEHSRAGSNLASSLFP